MITNERKIDPKRSKIYYVPHKHSCYLIYFKIATSANYFTWIYPHHSCQIYIYIYDIGNPLIYCMQSKFTVLNIETLTNSNVVMYVTVMAQREWSNQLFDILDTLCTQYFHAWG